MYPFPSYRRLPDCSSCSPFECPKTEAPTWCSAPLDSCGILATLGGILVALVGFHFGNVLVHKKNHDDRLKQWVPLSLFLGVAGVVLHFSGTHINQSLFSPPFLLVTTGVSGLALAFLYVILDADTTHPPWLSRYRKPCGWRIGVRPTDVLRPFVWVGMNSFFIYLLGAHGVLDKLLSYIYWGKPENNVVNVVFKAIFCHDRLPDTTPIGDLDQVRCQGGMFHGAQQRWAELLFTMLRVIFWLLVACALRMRRWYLVL
eukprot:m.213187 g.213187  ORF g.213187 m.213187 type:complete len:258 (+) comp18601_c0_seq1:795-1568(+)